MYTQACTDSYCLLRLKLDIYLLPRGESQWGAAFSSCIYKCFAFPLLHLGKSTEETLRVQPLCLLWRGRAIGYHDEVNKITPNSQISQKWTTYCTSCKNIHKFRHIAHAHTTLAQHTIHAHNAQTYTTNVKIAKNIFV